MSKCFICMGELWDYSLRGYKTCRCLLANLKEGPVVKCVCGKEFWEEDEASLEVFSSHVADLSPEELRVHAAMYQAGAKMEAWYTL